MERFWDLNNIYSDQDVKVPAFTDFLFRGKEDY